MAVRLYSRSFAGGELSPSMFGRIDDSRYQTGCAQLSNCLVTPTGAVIRRPGFAVIRAVKDSTKVGRLIDFRTGSNTGVMLEWGEGYLRIHENGATVLHPVAAAWSNVTAYVVGDLASRLGVTYYAKVAHTNQQPPNATYWHPQPSNGAYEVPHGLLEAQLFTFTYAQSHDVFSFCSQTGKPYELRRYGATTWKFEEIAFAPSLAAPTNLACPLPTRGLYIEVRTKNVGGTNSEVETPPAMPGGQPDHPFADGEVLWVSSDSSGTLALSGIGPGAYIAESMSAVALRVKSVNGGGTAIFSGAGATGYLRRIGGEVDQTETYVVTAVDSKGRESVTSSELTVTNNLAVERTANPLQWDAVTGAVRYYVYKKQSGLFGFIGQTDTNAFSDDNIGPDLSRTPPLQDATLSSTDYPAAVGYFEQRRWFAGTPLLPTTMWATRTNTEDELSYHLPIQATDRISVDMLPRERSEVRHIVGTKHLFVLTDSGEYRVTPLNDDAITPESISVRNETSIGSSNVRPIVTGSTMLFCANRGGHVREFGLQDGGFTAPDVSARAAHLFDGETITQSAFQRAPYPIAWFVSSNGRLLSFTYMPEEGVGGWSWHEAGGDGLFESVAVVPEGDEDRVYVICKRTIDGSVRRDVERMAAIATPEDIEDCTYLDSFITYSGAATTTITGLDHLEGEEVYALADGAVAGPFTVASGSIDLDEEATPVHVGFRYESLVRSLPLIANIDGFGKGRLWNVNNLWFQIEDSCQFTARPYNAGIVEADRASYEPVYLTMPSGATEMPIDSITPFGTVYVDAEGGWQQDGQVEVRMIDPLPLKLVSMTVGAEPGEG